MVAVTTTAPVGPLSFCIASSAKSRWVELALKSSPSTSCDYNPEEAVASRWEVHHRNKCLAEYAILQDLDGERRIVWETNEEKATCEIGS